LLVNGGTLAITNETALGNPTNPTANSLTLDGGTVLTTNTMLIGANPKRGLTLNSGGGTFNVTNASTLTLSNVIAGPGNTLTKTGNGTLVLAATNTHTLTVVNGGAVVCGTGYATGSAVSYTAGPTIQDGSVDINGCSSINISSGVNNYFINSTVTFGQKTGATSELKDTVAGHGGFGIWTPVPAVFYDGGNDPGKATISAPWCSCGSSGVTTRQIQVGTSANAPIGLEITGVMGQTAAVDGQNATIEKTGDGVLKISNTNKFPGLKISGGKLIAGHVNALGSVRALANTVTVTGYGSTLDLNGFSPTVSDLEDGGSSDGTVLNNGATPSTLTLNHGTVVSTFSGTLANGSSPLALIKAGANTVTLSGVNTYTGGTAVSNGTLVVSGSLSAGSAVTVQSSATFSVNGGIVNRPVTINDGGNVSLPGTGTLANLTFVNTGNMSFNVANGGILTVTTPGGITNNGAANSIIIDITGTAPAAGTYTLIAYTGSLNGSGFNAYKLGTTPGGARFTLVHNPGVAVELTVAPAFLWTGAQTSEWSINAIAGLKNWAFVGSPLDYTNGAAVGFDDSLTGTSTVDISVANVTPASVAFGNTAINYTLQGSAAIAGTASLAKNGTGTLTLLNNNTYTGPTAVNEGVVQVGTNGSSGSLGSGPITLSTDLQFNRSDSVTVANNISGVGTLEQNGSGTLTLSGTNTATGITTVNAGTLVVTGGSAIADTATVAVNNPATFQVNTSETIGSLVVYPGAAANANAGTLTASVVAMPGALTGSGTLTKIGTIDTTSAQFTTPNALAFNGTLRLRGSTPSTAPGSMQGATGRFWLGSPDGSQQPGTAFALDSGASRTDGQDLIIGDWDAASGNRSLTLSSLSGYGTIRTDSGSTGTRNLTVNQSGNTTFNGMLLSMYNGSALDRSIAFTKDGVGSLTLAGIVGYQTQSAAGTTPLTVTVLNGTLVLAATNTYTDPTTVSNGVLLVNGVLVSPVTVAGGSLGGTGVLSAPVSVGNGGTLFTSKTGLGTLTVSNALSFSAGSTNFTKVNAAASTSDLVQGFTSASYAGSMVVSNLSGTLTNGQSFPIFSAGGTGSFASITPAPGAGMTWNFNAASGVLSVASSTASNPTNISFSVSGSTMTLSWPADHRGWLLQAQTNSLSVGLGTNWVDVPGSDVVTSTNLPIVTGNPSVFYRLRHP
jgi:autotransporter-associated beta strand protein